MRHCVNRAATEAQAHDIPDPIEFLKDLGLHDVPLDEFIFNAGEISVVLRTANLNANWEGRERRPCQLVFSGVTGLSLHLAPGDGIRRIGSEKIAHASGGFVLELSLAQTQSPLDPLAYGFVTIAFKALSVIDMPVDG